MLYKQSAIAVMVALMLGAASIFGGLSTIPAFATHDSDAVELAREQITQEDDESVIIDTVELSAKKLISRALGTVTIEVIQDDDVLESASFETGALRTSFSTIEVDVTNINVTGSFEILVEYEGSSQVFVNDIDFVEGTDVAEDPDDTTDPDDGSEPNPPEEPVVLENVIASRTIGQDDDETMAVDGVEFDARKTTSRDRGTVTVALVQDNEILGQETFSTDTLKTSFTGKEATFDEEITGNFDVVFMYEGSGTIRITAINVLATTEPSEEEPNEEEPNEEEPVPEGEARLTVNAINQNGQSITGLWVAVLQGMSLVDSGETEVTFNLDAGEDYIVEMSDYYDDVNDVHYEFDGWVDSSAGSRRVANDLPATEEFTAKYIVTAGAGGPPPGDDETTPPPAGSGPGTVTVYAHRIPSEHWGPTFTSANAKMYFVLYNSTGDIVYTGFFDENGHTITGLNEGETYWVSPTDCDECHDDPHDVVFDHWHDGSTERQRAVISGDSASAHYRYEPDP